MTSSPRKRPSAVTATANARSTASRSHHDGLRASKRRRVEDPEEVVSPRKDEFPTEEEEDSFETAEEDVQHEDESGEEDAGAADPEYDEDLEEEFDEEQYGLDDDEDDDDVEGGVSLETLQPSKPLKALSSKRLEASQKAVKKTGVIYLSRVPPFMKPFTVKKMLSPYGEIGRVFLTPENPDAHKKRVKFGGNKKRSFTDGWVEFMNKKEAKIVAETLNAQVIGGKKGGWYHDDVWNIKYLKGFKWHHLTEQIANENAERAARMRAEIAQTTRENKIFLENVEKAKIQETKEAKRKGKTDIHNDILQTATSRAPVKEDQTARDKKGFRSHFRQNEVKLKAPKEKQDDQSDQVKRVLSKIF